MKFRLSRLPPDVALTKFHVFNSNGDTIGVITTPNEDADAFQQHWLGAIIQPQASASIRAKGNAFVSKMLDAGQRSNAPAPTTPRSRDENPMIAALLREAPKHRLTRTAILRGC